MIELEDDCENETISGNEEILKLYSKILRLLRLYYEGWSAFFIEDEYRYSIFNYASANTSINLASRFNIDITKDEEIRVTNNNINSFINLTSVSINNINHSIRTSSNTNTYTSTNTNTNRKEFMSTLLTI
jgi:hypothetical protein